MEVHPEPVSSTSAKSDFKPDKPYELKYIELCGQTGPSSAAGGVGAENVVFQNQLLLYQNAAELKAGHHLDNKMVELYSNAAQNVYSTLPRSTHNNQRYFIT